MIWIALISLVLGIGFGCLLLSPSMIPQMDQMMSYALILLLISVGIEVGTNKVVFRKIREYHIRILIIPFGVAVGSIGGGILLGKLLGDAPNVSAAISSGLGFYSVTAVLLRELGGSSLGTLAFLTNVFRELLSFLLIPLVAKYIGNYASIAPSGATAMDTTLPVIAKSTNHETALMAVITGVVLTTLVPIIVPIVFQL